MRHQANFTKAANGRALNVTRAYDAPLEKVWKAWTESKILDQWWGPKPWRAETKTFDFVPGGFWHYAMVGPNGEMHWSLVEFKAIVPQHSFSADCVFSDENGTPTAGFPVMRWHVEFFATPTGARVEVILSFDTEEGLNKIVEMGFQGGFTMGLNQLEELFEESLVV